MNGTVLLVEDNADNRAIYRMILEHFGYEVIEAHDGEAGVRLARDHLPDLILMDVSLPRIDGYTATGMLKADPATMHIPVVALTAHALAGEEQRARRAGCDSYLAKPVEPKRVVEEVRQLLAPEGNTDASEERRP
jgi:two-component system cell cycle response regulator DivK